MNRIWPYHRNLNSAVLLSTGNLGAALLILLRNIVIARLISVEDFGIAATFAIAVTLIETGTNLGMDRMIVQDRRGGQRAFLASMHAIQVLRGCAGACLTLMLAPLFAHAMGLPQYTWAYQCLAIIPLIRGATHLGMFRVQRSMRFLPFVTATLAANLLAVVAAIPLGLWLDDFRAMLGVILIQQAALLIGSHAVATGRYRLEWSPSILRDCLRFGLPLLLNGLVIFATLNGDQMLVGSFLGMETLGWFAVAFAIALVPATVLANTLQSLLLPKLSRHRANPDAFGDASWNVLQLTTALGIATCILLALIAPFAIEVLFGSRYEHAAAIVPWLAVLQGVRVAKAGPAILSIATGNTQDPLIANLARLAFLPVAVIWLGNGGDILSVVTLAIVGEATALGVSILLLARRSTIGRAANLRAVHHG